MISKKILPILIILALIMSLFICGLGIYVSKLEKANVQYNNEILAEKESIKLELKQLSDNYNDVQISNVALQEELDSSKLEMDSLYDAIDKTAPNLKLLRVYRSRISKLKKEKVRLLQANDSLITVNILMQDSINIKDSQIQEYFKVRQVLYDKNIALATEINKRKELKFYSTNGFGAIKVSTSVNFLMLSLLELSLESTL